jgi:hypothetical protein
LAGVTVTLVAREAVTLVAPDIVGTVCEHITGSVFTFIFIWHRAALATPAVITVTLGVQTGSIDTTVPCAVEAII